MIWGNKSVVLEPNSHAMQKLNPNETTTYESEKKKAQMASDMQYLVFCHFLSIYYLIVRVFLY